MSRLNVILICVCSVLLGFCIYSFGRYRGATNTIANYKQLLADTKQQLTELSREYGDLLNQVERDNDTARSIVKSMGEQLQSSDGTLRGAITSLNTLRALLKDLQDLYSSEPNSRNRNRDDNNVEDM